MFNFLNETFQLKSEEQKKRNSLNVGFKLEIEQSKAGKNINIKDLTAQKSASCEGSLPQSEEL